MTRDEAIAAAERIVASPYTKTIPWTGSSRVEVPCGPSYMERELAQALLDATSNQDSDPASGSAS